MSRVALRTVLRMAWRRQDVATRLFLKRLKRELNIPVMGLVDSDPYGLKILSVYMSGEREADRQAARPINRQKDI